jgi:microcystin-dependent protein
VGVNNTYLMANSTCPNGIEWAVGMGDTPVGSVQYFAMSTPPPGWLVADGSAVSRTTYSSLFTAIGTTYGAGDTTTTFNLPDLKGQFLRGWNSTGTGCDASRVFGSTQQDSIECHQHVFPWGENSTGQFGQTATGGKKGIATGQDFDNFWWYTNNGTNYDGVLNPAGVIGNETRPVNVAMLPCIKWQVTTAPSSCGIPCACITGKGALVTGTAADTPVAIPVGTDGQALVACAACPTGLTWTTPAVPVSPATPTVAGIVLGCTVTTNTAIGYGAFACNTAGLANAAFGSYALDANTIGEYNTALGYDTMSAHTTGCYSVAVGGSALRDTVSGGCNTAVGFASLLKNTGAGNNTAIGFYAGACITTGTFNVGVGSQTFFSASSGDYNVAVGSLAHGLLTTGTRNVAIGPNANVTLPAGDCQLAIGFANGCNWLTGDSSKNIQPGAGIKDCTGSVGGICEYLVSTGTALKWITPPSTNYRQCVAGCFTTPVSTLCQIAGVSLTTSGNPIQLNAYGDAYSSGSNWYGCVFIRRCGSPNVDSRSSWLENNAGNLNEAFALSYIDNPPAGTYCYALMMCVPSGSGGNVIAGEAGGPVFNAVELGTVAPGMTPSWTSAGTIQSIGWTSTTNNTTFTNVVPGTTSRNNISYRQTGPKEWDVVVSFTQTANFINGGSGDYIFTLPNGLQFNTTLPWQQAFTGNLQTNSSANWQYVMGGSSMGQTSFTNGSNSSIYGTGVVIYDSTRFRLFTSDGNNAGLRSMGSSYWGGTSVLTFTYSFTLQTP